MAFTNIEADLRTLKLSELSVLIEDINYNFSVLRSHPMFQGFPGKPGDPGTPGNTGTRGSRWLFIRLEDFKKAFEQLGIEILSKDDITLDWLNKQVSYNSGYEALCQALGVSDFVDTDIVVLSTTELVEFTFTGGRQFLDTGVSINKDYGYITESRVKELIQNALGSIADQTTISQYKAYVRNFPDGTFGINAIANAGGALDVTPGTSEAVEDKSMKFFSYVPDSLSKNQSFIFGNTTDYSKLVNGAIDPGASDSASAQLTNEYSPGEGRTAAGLFMQDNYYNGIMIGHKNGEYVKANTWNRNFRQFSRMFMSFGYNKTNLNYTDTSLFGLHITSGYGKRLYDTTSPAEYCEIFLQGPHKDNNSKSVTGIQLITSLVECLNDLKVYRNILIGGSGTIEGDLIVSGSLSIGNLNTNGSITAKNSITIVDKNNSKIFESTANNTVINSTKITLNGATNFSKNVTFESDVIVSKLSTTEDQFLNLDTQKKLAVSKYSVNNNKAGTSASPTGIDKPLFVSDTTKLLLEYKLNSITSWVEQLYTALVDYVDKSTSGQESKFEQLAKDITDLRKQINKVAVDLQNGLSTVNNTIAKIQEKFTDVMKLINANTTSINELRNRFEAHIKSNEQSFEELNNKFNGYDQKIEDAKQEAIDANSGAISNVRQEFQQGLGLLEDEVDKLRDEVAKLGGEITGGTTENATVEPLKTGTVIEIFTLRKSGESDRDMLGRLIDLVTLKGKKTAEIIVPTDNAGGTKTKIMDLTDYIFCGGTDVFANDSTSGSKIPNYTGKVLIGGGKTLNQLEYGSLKNIFLMPDNTHGSYSFNIDQKYLLSHTHNVSVVELDGTISAAGAHNHQFALYAESAGRHTHMFNYKRDVSTSGVGAIPGANGAKVTSALSPILEDGNNGEHTHIISGEIANCDTHTHTIRIDTHKHVTLAPENSTLAGTNSQEVVPYSMACLKFMYIGDFTTADFALRNHKHTDYALVNHTHQYAGSESVGGAANSAVKLVTPINITLTGAVSGSLLQFDGSKSVTINTTVNHTHNYAGSSSPGGAANSVKNSLTLKLGSETYTYNGSSAITTNITPSAIGAAPTSHNHTGASILLTGYQNNQSGAISPDDNVLVALSKLEKKITDVAGGTISLATLTIQNSAGVAQVSYDGSSNKILRLNASMVGAASASHTHSGASITLSGYNAGAAGSVNANDSVNTAISKLQSAINALSGGGTILNNTLTITVNGSATSFDGSSAKTVSINTGQITSGASNSKLYIVGATSQSSSPITSYSNSKCFIGTDGCLYSNSTKVSIEGHTHNYAPTVHTHNQYLRNDTTVSQTTSNLTITGSFTAKTFYKGSDKRLKNNIKSLSNNILESSLNVESKQFDLYDNIYKHGKSINSYGVIADTIPPCVDVVDTDINGVKHVDYDALHSIQIEALKQENKKLKNEINELNRKLDKIFEKLGN